jgi:hypothetical protein
METKSLKSENSLRVLQPEYCYKSTPSKGYPDGVNETLAQDKICVGQVGQRLQQNESSNLCLEVAGVELVPAKMQLQFKSINA